MTKSMVLQIEGTVSFTIKRLWQSSVGFKIWNLKKSGVAGRNLGVMTCLDHSHVDGGWSHVHR